MLTVKNNPLTFHHHSWAQVIVTFGLIMITYINVKYLQLKKQCILKFLRKCLCSSHIAGDGIKFSSYISAYLQLYCPKG